MEKISENLEVIKVLGNGATSTVYKCNYNKDGLNRIVAVKCFKKEYLSNNSKDQIIKEAQFIANISHSNIATVFDVNLNCDQPHIIYEFVGEISLKDAMNSNSITSKDAIAIYNQLLDALNFLKNNQIVHGDLKPSNIILDSQNNPKIIDFGVSELYSESSSNVLSGTLQYIDPRIIQTKSRADFESDLYSLNLILFELLSRQRFFSASSTPDLLNELSNFNKVTDFDVENIPTEFKDYLINNLGLKVKNRRSYKLNPTSYENVDQTIKIRKVHKKKSPIIFIAPLIIVIALVTIFHFSQKDQYIDILYTKNEDTIKRYSIKKYESYTNGTFNDLTCDIIYIDLINNIKILSENAENKIILENIWNFIESKPSICPKYRHRNMYFEMKDKIQDALKRSNPKLESEPEDLFISYDLHNERFKKENYLNISSVTNTDVYLIKDPTENKCSAIFDTLIYQNETNYLGRDSHIREKEFKVLFMPDKARKSSFQIKGKYNNKILFEVTQDYLIESSKWCYCEWKEGKKECYLDKLYNN